MNLYLRKIGGQKYSSMELTIETSECTITEDVTDLQGFTPESLIDSLREIANELEDRNDFLNDNKKN